MNNELSILNSTSNFVNDTDDSVFNDEVEETTPVIQKEIPKTEPKPLKEEVKPTEKKRREWKPDQKLIADMPELNVKPVTYSKDEFKIADDTTLKNITDESAKKDAAIVLESLQLKDIRIQKIKEKYGIKHLNIPEYSEDGKNEDLEGKVMRCRILSVASDPKEEVAMAKLSEIFDDIVANHPEYIKEWIKEPEQTTDEDLVEDVEEDEEQEVIEANYEVKKESIPDDPSKVGFVSNVIIDKSNISNYGWTEEEFDKISKSREINLKIIDGMDLKFNKIIEEDDENVIDSVLHEYRRKLKDVTVVLPASKYCGTMRGLSYIEMSDLSYQAELSPANLYNKGWTMIYDHFENISIGLESYSYFIDPTTKQKIRITESTEIPEGCIVKNVSRYEDFLMKTSFADYQFLLWKLLCATILESEIITLTCGTVTNGKRCNARFDWLYSPESLIDMSKMDPEILKGMKKSAECIGEKMISENYKESFLVKNQSVELPCSKIRCIFGHVSVYDYINKVLPSIPDLNSLAEKEDDFDAAISVFLEGMLQVVKYFLIPREDGTAIKVSSVEGLKKIIKQLNEVDFATLNEVAQMVIKPFSYDFAIRGVECPKCKSKINIPVSNILQLIFQATRILSKTQVTLKV